MKSYRILSKCIAGILALTGALSGCTHEETEDGSKVPLSISASFQAYTGEVSSRGAGNPTVTIALNTTPEEYSTYGKTYQVTSIPYHLHTRDSGRSLDDSRQRRLHTAYHIRMAGRKHTGLLHQRQHIRQQRKHNKRPALTRLCLHRRTHKERRSEGNSRKIYDRERFAEDRDMLDKQELEYRTSETAVNRCFGIVNDPKHRYITLQG